MKASRLKILYSRRAKSAHVQSSFEDIDSSSIGDLAFLLLIFFIVTSSFLLNQGVLFSLPEKDAATQKVKVDRLIKIRPLKEGFKFNNKTFNRFDVKARIKAKMENIKIPILIIEMGDDVAYARFIDALSIGKELKIRKISIAPVRGRRS